MQSTRPTELSRQTASASRTPPISTDHHSFGAKLRNEFIASGQRLREYISGAKACRSHSTGTVQACCGCRALRQTVTCGFHLWLARARTGKNRGLVGDLEQPFRSALWEPSDPVFRISSPAMTG